MEFFDDFEGEGALAGQGAEAGGVDFEPFGGLSFFLPVGGNPGGVDVAAEDESLVVGGIIFEVKGDVEGGGG